MSFSLATICMGSNAQEGAFCLSFGMRHTAINASTDIGEVVDWTKRKFSVTAEGGHNLAVLHNRNKMVNAFAATEWVASSEGTVLSRSVTSCAGMTAYLVLLAQTKVGFLSGGRGKTFQQLTPMEQSAKKKKHTQGRQWPLHGRSKSASSWGHWT